MCANFQLLCFICVFLLLHTAGMYKKKLKCHCFFYVQILLYRYIILVYKLREMNISFYLQVTTFFSATTTIKWLKIISYIIIFEKLILKFSSPFISLFFKTPLYFYVRIFDLTKTKYRKLLCNNIDIYIIIFQSSAWVEPHCELCLIISSFTEHPTPTKDQQFFCTVVLIATQIK